MYICTSIYTDKMLNIPGRYKYYNLSVSNKTVSKYIWQKWTISSGF